jgi:hypothetical protein
MGGSIGTTANRYSHNSIPSSTIHHPPSCSTYFTSGSLSMRQQAQRSKVHTDDQLVSIDGQDVQEVRRVGEERSVWEEECWRSECGMWERGV